MKSNYFTTFLAIVIFTHRSSSQNLIPNPDFEDVNICHEYQEDCSPKAWRTTSLKSVGYFNHQRKKSSLQNSFINLLLYDEARNFDRKFIQAELLCPLIKNKKYKLSIQLNANQYHIEEVGILFNEEIFLAKNNKSLKHKKADIILKIPTSIKESEWFSLEYEYLAKGNEKTIMIGNFLPDERINIFHLDPKKEKKRGKKKNQAKINIKYGIDNLSLSPMDSITICDINKNKWRIYQDSMRHTLDQIKISPSEIKELAENKIEQSNQKKAAPPNKETIILKNIEFEFGKAALKANWLPDLDRVLQILNENKNKTIEIIGYTDSKGTEEFNLKLSEHRAKVVHHYLSAKGVDQNRMTYKGMGETNPLESNDTEEGRQANRRVEIIITGQQ